MRQMFCVYAVTFFCVFGWYVSNEIYKSKVNIWNKRRLDESVWSYLSIIPFINILWWLKDKYLAKKDGKNGTK